jgi:hypothetical protein
MPRLRANDDCAIGEFSWPRRPAFHPKFLAHADAVEHPTPLATYMNTLMYLQLFWGDSPSAVIHDSCGQSTPSNFDGVPASNQFFNLDSSDGASNVALVQAAANKFKN